MSITLNDIPDLKDWRYVEVWTLEEAAFLWAGIDPASYPDKTLSNIQHLIHPEQFRKAWTSRKAFCEAVCLGTLPFVSAYEFREESNYGNAWEIQINFPDLPNPQLIMPHLTRVSQAALLKWASNKLPSLKQDLKKKSEKLIVEQPPTEEPKRILAPQNYTTPALELMSTHIYENLAGLPPDEQPTPTEQKEWLKQQAAIKGLSGREAEAVYVVARPPEVKQRVQPKNKKE